MFLKVIAMLTAYLQQLSEATCSTVARDREDHRPSIKTARTPTAQSCLGNVPQTWGPSYLHERFRKSHWQWRGTHSNYTDL